MRRIITAVAVLLATLVASPATPSGAISTWAPDPSTTVARTQQCIQGDPSPEVLSGLMSQRYEPLNSLPDGTTIDARGAGWQLGTGSLQHNTPWTATDVDKLAGPAPWTVSEPEMLWPIQLGRDSTKLVPAPDGEPDHACVLGGRVWSATPDRFLPDDPATPYHEQFHDPYGWEYRWHHSAGLRLRHVESPTVVGVEMRQVGDGIDFQGLPTGSPTDPWEVHGARLSEVHDDCIEADQNSSGLIADSLLDGCFVAVAAQGGGPTPPGAKIAIRDSLIRMQPMNQPFNPAKYGYTTGSFTPFHGQIFKWDSDAPALELDNVVISAGDSMMGSGNIFTLPAGTQCSDSILVWTGSAAVSALPPNVQQCFDEITTDPSVFAGARAAWIAARPSTSLPVPGTPGVPVVTPNGQGLSLSWTPASGNTQGYTVSLYDTTGVLRGTKRLGIPTGPVQLEAVDLGRLNGWTIGKVEVRAMGAGGLGPASSATGLWIPPHRPSGSVSAVDRLLDAAHLRFPGAPAWTPTERALVPLLLQGGISSTADVVIARRDHASGAAETRWEVLLRMNHALFGQQPTTAELSWYDALVALGASTPEAIADALMTDARVEARFPSSWTDEEFVIGSHHVVLGRAPTNDERLLGLALLQSWSRGRFVHGLSTTPTFQALIAAPVEAEVLRWGMTSAMPSTAQLDSDVATLTAPGAYQASQRALVVEALMSDPAYVSQLP